MNIQKALFGKTAGGRQVDVYTITNKNGMQLKVLNYGGIILELWAPDRNGRYQDVIVGYADMAGILADSYYMGAIVGRYGNRIARGQFSLDGHVYRLARNNGLNHLHGGQKGFDKVLYTAEEVKKDAAAVLKLSYLSRDGEEGYPGNLQVNISYTLTENNEFSIDYSATTDRRTVINLTNHAYFNLTADFARDILQHQLQVYADKFTPTDSGSIPTGDLLPVENTPLDFTRLTTIGDRINADFEQLKFARGYDQNFVLNKKSAGALALAAKVYEPTSGRCLEISTTEPAVQFYSGNFLDGTKKGKGGKTIQWRGGLCLEPQHFPDSPNQPKFPATVLDPGKLYQSKSVYKFTVEK
jgi:aldose 1-epimerase